MLMFQRESFDSCYPEAKVLLERHYEEVAWNREKIPLVVDEEIYRAVEGVGQLVCFTARWLEKLVGYSVFFMRQHPHYLLTKYATNDVIYLDPLHRGQTGAKFIHFAESELKLLGAQVVHYHVKHILDFGPMLKRNGYESVETAWQKWVGE
jgi:hypothetical protein